MSTAGIPPEPRILAVRLGAMGDIVHTLPAVAVLKRAHPGANLTWVVEPQWAALLEGNPFVDRVLLLRRGSAAGLMESWRDLRAARFDFAVDFQGLLKSAVVAAAARPARIFGFDAAQLRERAAALFYTDRIATTCAHVVDRNCELVGHALAPGRALACPPSFPLPPGRPEGALPEGGFVLASPLAGWPSKQWPAGHYQALARRLRRERNLPLVLNGREAAHLPAMEGALPHVSGLPGLIFATRRASAVVGVDSGPMHIAAALGKPGVAIFGPTDPARNGPYGTSMRVLRRRDAVTTYRRGTQIDESMRHVSPDEVFEELRMALDCAVP
ncbi:MAG TPA: glycosyltransferase family 9 protein [Bryobacteraceae bacterium]|nr:glycosyltransferase family 9 protein [Bryobacteraceae bacterium]